MGLNLSPGSFQEGWRAHLPFSHSRTISDRVGPRKPFRFAGTRKDRKLPSPAVGLPKKPALVIHYSVKTQVALQLLT